jgi:hypothetical protein
MKETLQDEEGFTSYLSDFVQAARSITLHMQKQYVEKEGFGKKNGVVWDGWYGYKEAEMRKIPYLRFLIKARNYSEKEGPILIGATRGNSYGLSAIIVKEGQKAEELVSETIEFFPALEPPGPKTIARLFWNVSSYMDKGDKAYALDFEKADVIKTCEYISDYLDKLVNECEEKFSQI